MEKEYIELIDKAYKMFAKGQYNYNSISGRGVALQHKDFRVKFVISRRRSSIFAFYGFDEKELFIREIERVVYIIHKKEVEVTVGENKNDSILEKYVNTLSTMYELGAFDNE